MYVLNFKKEMSQKDIADYWDVTEASVSRQVNILRQKGFVEKKPSTHLTLKGKKVLDDALSHATATFEEVFEGVTDTERKHAVALLEKLSADARKYLEMVDEGTRKAHGIKSKK